MAAMINFRIRMLSKFLSVLTKLLAAGLALIVLTAAMIIVQAQRDETRPADIAFVLNNTAGQSVQPQLDTALILHRRGIVSRILLAGSESAAAGRYLAQQGTPAAAVLISSEPGGTLPQQMASAAQIARTAGATSVVIVADRWELLRVLKIARDDGLIAYGTPAQGANRRSILNTGTLIVRESWAYLSYLFVGK